MYVPFDGEPATFQMNKKPTDSNSKSKTYSSYLPSDYPNGIDDFLRKFPPERHAEIRATVIHFQLKNKAEKKWVSDQIAKMQELPHILYKYVPLHLANPQHTGFPKILRATQPNALNDVMEGNIRTTMESKMDPDRWYGIISASLQQVFGNDALSDDELERRRKRYGDPRISTIIRDYLSQFVGVISFSTDPLIPTMWAHYAENSGFVVGYNTGALKELGVDIRRVLYLELAPAYMPTRDNIVRLQFVDEEARQRRQQAGRVESGTPLLGCDIDFVELRKDWSELARVLFVKGQAWEYEREARLLVDLDNTRLLKKKDKNGHEIRVVDLPAEAIEEVYVGFNTPRERVNTIKKVVGVGQGNWKLKYTDSHAYRMQVTTTLINSRSRS